MRLKLLVRRAGGDVAILQCEGMIVSGQEAEHLEEKVNRELTEGSRNLVMELGAISRVDSAGLGMMVRLMTRARKAGGDLKLASPPAFVGNLLQMTKLATLFHVFPSEQEAVLSYRGPKPQMPKPEPAKARIILLDQSVDVCAFVRTVLSAHGYEVLSTTFIREARILLQAGRTDVLLLGPNTSHFPITGPSLVSSLAALAPTARIVELDKNFQGLDAEHAGAVLLRAVSGNEEASASGSV